MYVFFELLFTPPQPKHVWVHLQIYAFLHGSPRSIFRGLVDTSCLGFPSRGNSSLVTAAVR